MEANMKKIYLNLYKSYVLKIMHFVAGIMVLATTAGIP
jgi:hypothetical protein